jgi:glycosyltransferase involved in cell wall biosynthesis
MIEAFLDVDTPMPLVIVGRKAWMWESELGWIDTALDEKTRKRLRFLGFVEREDLRRLYAGARFFLFPSLYEGFGLPALEAMTLGCPVITSNASSLREVCGDAAVYADPLDRSDILRKIELLMAENSLRETLAQARPSQAAKFSFQAHVERLAAAYRGLGALLA